MHLAARFIIQHLLTQLNHFPFGSTGPSKIVSSVNETSDLSLNLDELTPLLFEQPNIQFFTVNNQFLISFVELPMKGNEQFFNINPELKTSATICRFIVRDFCGKNCWDCCLLQSPDESLPHGYMLEIPVKSVKIASPEDPSSAEASNDGDSESAENMEIAPVSIESSDNNNNNNNTFDFTQLPFLNHEDIPKDIDILDNVSKLKDLLRCHDVLNFLFFVFRS